MPNLKLPKVPKPFTPMRRLIYDVLKPSMAIGKRLRDVYEEQENIPPEGTHMAVDQTCAHTRNCVALQNDDTEEDAVVITALDAVPFCCHADLLLMNRAQLVEVANNLNTKLPLAMRIDTSASRSDSFIRNSIELLVGIRHVVPSAPKPNRSLSLSVSNFGVNDESLVSSILPLSPVSPLATRKRQAAAIPEHAVSPPLTSLMEESEDTDILSELTPYSRPQKRRRISEERDSSPDVSPTPVRVRTSCRPRGRVLRSQSHRTTNIQPKFSLDAAAGRDGRILRSRSERIPPLKSLGIHRNVTVTRGRGGASGRGDQRLGPAPVMTSTPKAHLPTLMYSTSASMDNSLLQLEGMSGGPINSVSVATMSSSAGYSSSGSLSSTQRLERIGVWLTRHTGGDKTKDTEAVITGIENLTLRSALSDMDISL